MRYTWSSKAHLFDSERNGSLLYSGYTNSFFKVQDSLKEAITKFRSGYPEALDDDVISLFVKTGVLHDGPEEAFFDRVKLNAVRSKYSAEMLMITLAVTMDCNFRCSYCYEKGENTKQRMSRDLLDRILDFMQKSRRTRFNITWYGGEPLLAQESIQYFNERVRALDLEVGQQLVTNGYLLDEDGVQFLDRNRIRSVQITVDGSEKSHNLRRPHEQAGDSYQRIMNNLNHIYRRFGEQTDGPRFSIRVNLDKENQGDFIQILTAIREKYGTFFNVYPAFIKDSNSCISDKSCLLDSKAQAEFFRENYLTHGVDYGHFFPVPAGFSHCSAQTFDNCVIDPDGNLFKCWEDVGFPGRAVRNLMDNTIGNQDVEVDYILKSDAMNDSQCRDCLLLFSCRGGCPRQRIDAIAAGKRPQCPVMKQALEEFLEYHYEIQKQNTARACQCVQ